MSRVSPNARALAECRKRGWPAQTVEQRIPHTFITRDLFGVIDIVALAGPRIIGIQVTSGSNHAARIAKIAAEPRAKAWCEAGGKIEVWSWSKRGAKGKRKVWTMREQEWTP